MDVDKEWVTFKEPKKCATSYVTLHDTGIQNTKRRTVRPEYSLVIDEACQCVQVGLNPSFRFLEDATAHATESI